MLVLALVDSLLQDTQRHGFLDDIVIIGNEALVDTAVKQSRGIMTTTLRAVRYFLTACLTRQHLLWFSKIVDRHGEVHHGLPLLAANGAVILDGGDGLLWLSL